MAKKDKKDKEKDPSSENAEGSEAAGTESAEANLPSPKKKKLLLIVGIGAIGLLAAGVGGFFIMKTLSAPHPELAAQNLHEGDKSSGAETHDSQESEEETPSTKANDPEHSGDHAAAPDQNGNPEQQSKDPKDTHTDSFGDTLDLPRMDVNLGNPLENRFLRLGVSIEYHGGEAQLQSLQRRMPLIKDVVITLISKKTRIELLSPTGKEAFRKQLKNTLNEVLEKPVTNVYFTEFLVE